MASDLKESKWSAAQQSLLAKYFKDNQVNWKKKTLATLREGVKAELLQAQHFLCAYCRVDIEDNAGKMEIDHVVPQSLAPQFTYEKRNLVATCKRCNQRKGDHNPTTHPSVVLWTLPSYPSVEHEFIWVHPYFHEYAQHIDIIKSHVYVAKNASKQGAEVIRACRLDEMKQVLARRRMAVAARSTNMKTLLLRLIAMEPQIDAADIATQVLKSFPNSADRLELIKIIGSWRDGDGVEGLKLQDLQPNFDS